MKTRKKGFAPEKGSSGMLGKRKRQIVWGVLLVLLWMLLRESGSVHAYFTAVDNVSCAFEMDLIPPQLTVITPAGLSADDPTYAVSPLYDVTGLVSDDKAMRQVTVNGSPATMDEGGAWIREITLTDGQTQKVEVTAVDQAGNEVTEIRYVRYDSSILFEDFIVTRWNRAKVGYTSDTTELVIPETFYDEETSTWYHVVEIGFRSGDTTNTTYAAFSNCTNLVRVVIPGSVKRILRYAFYGATGITEVQLGYGVEYIDMSVFYKCQSLKTVVLPESITTLGGAAFAYASALENVVLPSQLTEIYSNLFCCCYQLSGQMVIPDGVTAIGEGAFMSTDITSVVLPASVTSVAKNAFRSCDQLTHVYYQGTQEQWGQISMGSYNTALTGAQIIYEYAAD